MSVAVTTCRRQRRGRLPRRQYKETPFASMELRRTTELNRLGATIIARSGAQRKPRKQMQRRYLRRKRLSLAAAAACYDRHALAARVLARRHILTGELNLKIWKAGVIALGLWFVS